MLAAVGTTLLAARITLPQSFTLGELGAIATIPVWYPVARRYVGTRCLMYLGLAAIAAGLVLTLLSSTDHEISRTATISSIAVLVGVLTGFGFLLWARTVLGDGALATLYGIGLLVALYRPDPLYATNPWKFGFSVPVTIIVLALLNRFRALTQLAALGVLVLVSALADARSSFGILLLAAALLAWQLRSVRLAGRRSSLATILGLGVVAAVMYYVGQALIVAGYLGSATRNRSLKQLDTAGSLILGGRPEITATFALMREHILGFGSGALPAFSDITVAKTGMAHINYDPNNGYVEHYMFGDGFELHSIFGDLWSDFGLVGLALCLAMLVLVLQGATQAAADREASGLLLWVSVETLWNIAFSPLYSSVPVLMLALALVLVPRADAARAARG